MSNIHSMSTNKCKMIKERIVLSLNNTQKEYYVSCMIIVESTFHM